MNRTLIYLPPAHKSAACGALLDKALELSLDGKELVIGFCDGALSRCSSNMEGDRAKCKSCSLMHRNLTKKFLPNVSVLSMRDCVKDNGSKKVDFSYTSIGDIKSLAYRNVNVGLPAYSSYVSATRNAFPVMDIPFRKEFDTLLRQSCLVTDIALSLNDRFQSFICFNGRHLETRPFLDVRQAKGNSYVTIELGADFEGNLRRYEFHNSLPHNIKAFTRKVNLYWDTENDATNREKVSKLFFERKLNQLPAGDKVFTKGQQTNKLPKYWDADRVNVVIFTSSEDEFVGIGDEYDVETMFSNQAEGIAFLAKRFRKNKNIRFYVRIHPNLKGVKYDYHSDLKSLSIYRNVEVILAESDIDSYALLQASSKVIVFNSTMGVEGNYLRKPVILLTPALYQYLDVSYNPVSTKELEDLITKDLVPKPIEGSLKYGYYYSYVREQFWSNLNFSTRKTYKILSKNYSFPVYSRLLGSPFIFYLYYKLRGKFPWY